MPIQLSTLAIFSLLSIAGLGCAIADARTGYGPGPLTSGEAALGGFFGFFGIGAVPPLLALAVLLGTGAVAGATLDAIAHLHLGHAYPPWFPAGAAASGLGVGLLCARALAATPLPHDEGSISARQIPPAPPDPAYKNQITF
jgi:hypothetical protein